MGILAHGKIIKKKVKDLTFMRMDKNIMEVGLRIKNKVKVNTNIKTMIYIQDNGRMIDVMVMEL